MSLSCKLSILWEILVISHSEVWPLMLHIWIHIVLVFIVDLLISIALVLLVHLVCLVKHILEVVSTHRTRWWITICLWNYLSMASLSTLVISTVVLVDLRRGELVIVCIASHIFCSEIVSIEIGLGLIDVRLVENIRLVTIVLSSEWIRHLWKSVLRSSLVKIGLVCVEWLAKLLLNLINVLLFLILTHVGMRHCDVILRLECHYLGVLVLLLHVVDLLNEVIHILSLLLRFISLPLGIGRDRST